jgi:hypothetical protein
VTPRGYEGMDNNQYDTVVEEEKIGLETSQRNLEKRKEVELEIARKKARKRAFKRRVNKEKIDWTPTDVSHEFAEILLEAWHVTPWEVSKSKLAPAIAKARKKFETNGEIEVKMIARFFEEVKTSHIHDAEVIWKMFIYRFSELANYVMLREPKFGQIENANYEADKQYRKEFPTMFMTVQDKEMYEVHEEAINLFGKWKEERRNEYIQREITELSDWQDQAYLRGIIGKLEDKENILKIKEKYRTLINYL